METTGFYVHESERLGKIVEYLSSESIDFSEAARELLYMCSGYDVQYRGLYHSDIDWDFFAEHVIVADLDAGKEYRRPILVIYDKRSLINLARDVLTAEYLDEDGSPLEGEDRAAEIFESFNDGLEDCEAPHEQES